MVDRGDGDDIARRPPRRRRPGVVISRGIFRSSTRLLLMVSLTLSLIRSATTTNSESSDGKTERVKHTRRRFTLYERKYATNGAQRSRRPTVWRVTPSRGHSAGGTDVRVVGSGFVRTRELACRFGGTGTVIQTPATYVSASEVRCTTPAVLGSREGRFTAHVSVRNNVESGWSSEVGDFTTSTGGSGERSFAAFEYDSSAPGCYGCFESSVTIGSRSRESWETVGGAATGPEDGGTTVRIRATSASGDGSRGTFYPGAHLRCAFSCPKILTNGTGVGYEWSSGWAASTIRWIGYDEIECVSPPWPGIGVTCSEDGSPCVSTVCRVRVTNDGRTFDDFVSAGGDGDGVEQPMANAAYVAFTYDVSGAPPIVSGVTSIRTPSTYTAHAARGPFKGGTVVTITGSGFLKSAHLACLFSDNAAGTTRETEVPATFVSSSEILCVSPSRIVDETFGLDSFTDAPCFESDVRVSNTGTNARAGTWSAVSVASKFFYCDLYVASARQSDSGSTDDGSPTKPFATIQAALDVALRSLDEDAASSLNHDVIRLAPGAYAGRGNNALFAHQVTAEIVPVSKEQAATVVDCEGAHPLFVDQSVALISSRDEEVQKGVSFDSTVVLVRCHDLHNVRLESCDAYVDSESGDEYQSCRFS